MAAVDPAPTSASVEPRWGLGDAVGGWLIAYTSASFLGLLILTAFGYTAEEIEANEIPLTMVALSYPPLWLGFVGVPIWAAAVKGRGWVVDFRARWSWRGLPGTDAQREVTVMAEKSLPYAVLRKIVASCSAADYTKVSLAVVEREQALAAQAGA